MTSHLRIARWSTAGLLGLAAAGAVLSVGGTATAAIVPTVSLATTEAYAVLGGSTVTNTGLTVLDGSLGVSPGTAVTGFPPGVVLPPGTVDVANAVALQAQADLTAAYNNAAGRPIDATTPADLANLTLVGGVYAGPSKGDLALNGPLVLDGAGNSSSVFIFQTNATLITGTASTVTLINGAQECNVFWQVGSSATLGTSSLFAGNILALTSISLNDSVVVRGRALARNGAVTLINDTFLEPTCAIAPPGTTTSTSAGATSTSSTLAATTTTSAGGTTTSTNAGTTTSTGGTTTSTNASTTTSTNAGTTTSTLASPAPAVTTAPVVSTTTSTRSQATTTTTRLVTEDALRAGDTSSVVTATAAAPFVPAVVGVPRTGGRPTTHADGRWLVMLFAAVFGIAVASGARAWRRSR